jgi:hypothetical protein
MGQGWFALEPARVHTEGQFPCFFVRKAPGHFGGMTARSWSHGVELVGVVPEKTIWFDSFPCACWPALSVQVDSGKK